MAFVSESSPLVAVWQRAHALVSAGDLAGARAVLEHGVELGRVKLAEDDPGVLRTAFELGVVLQRGDDPVGARRVLEEAYAAGQWRLGDADPLMVRISHGIGVVAEELGNRHEARKAFSRVAEFGPAVLGDGHPAVARARAYLGAEATGRGASHPGVGASQAKVEPSQTAIGAGQTGIGAGQAGIGAGQAGIDAGQTGIGAGQAGIDASRAGIGASGPGEGQEATPPAERFGGRERTSLPASDETGGVAEAVLERPWPAVGGPSGGEQRVWVDPATAYRGVIEEPTVLQPVVVSRVGADGGEGYASAPSGGAGQGGHPSGSLTPYGHRRGLGVFAAVAAGVAAVFAVVALVVVLAGQVGGSGGESDVPTLAGDAPTDVRLSDSGSGIGVSWQDPAAGTVSFMVIMGRPGVELKPVGTLGPGQTSFAMSGLNPSLDYCFAVVAVYQKDQFATSPQTCTKRSKATPR